MQPRVQVLSSSLIELVCSYLCGGALGAADAWDWVWKRGGSGGPDWAERAALAGLSD